MNWLRKRVRKWLGVTDVPVIVEQGPNGTKIAPGTLSLFEQSLKKAGERWIVPRKVQAPALPPMVRDSFVFDAAKDIAKLGAPMMAFDDASNAPMWAYLNQANCGLGFPGYGYLAELSQRSEYRAPTETTASELTREWVEITVKGKAAAKKKAVAGDDPKKPKVATDRMLREDELRESARNATATSSAGDNEGEGEDADGDGIDDGQEDKIEKLEAALEKFQVREHFRKIAEVDGFFGRAQLFINIETGKDPDEVNQLPLVVDPETIKKGTLKGFKVIEPIWTSPYTYNATDPARPDFYKPRAWFVMGKRVHASRLLTFISREVPDMLKPAYNFGGLSLTQLMEPYVFQWLRTRNSVSDLIHNFSVMVLKTDMSQVLQGDADAGSNLLTRAQLFTQTRDNQGLTLIDKNREEMQEVHTSLAGLDKLQAQAQEHMAAPSHIPLVKLTGVTPAGLNANSEGEIQVWYDWVRSMQMAFFSKHFKHILDILQLNEFGAIDEAIGFEWVPLSSPTVKETAEIRKANSETDDKYVAMGAVSPEEVRERIAADPNSGFNNLSGPAPEPPEMDAMATQATLGEMGKQADHQRNMEMQKESNKIASDAWEETLHPRDNNGQFGSGSSSPSEFERGRAQQDKLYATLMEKTEALAAKHPPAGLMGMHSDEQRADPEYRKMKQEVDVAFEAVRNFNGRFVKKYSRELAEARRAEKIAKRDAAVK